MDNNLDRMSHAQLMTEAKKLRQGIREYRGQSRPRIVLAPSGVMVAAAVAVGPVTCRARLASAHPRMHQLSPFARQAGGRSAAQRRAISRMNGASNACIASATVAGVRLAQN